jgi:1-acyl-sn-glycerol-3-phosphate acyltransferase
VSCASQRLLFAARHAAYASPVAERVYPPVILFARSVFKALGLRIRIEGTEHIPLQGGAVLASNHIGYLDFTFCGLAAYPRKRLVRFMAKESVFRHPVSGPLMRGMHHIPVDRAAGAAAFDAALHALKEGEIVGVFPEATISRSWMVKELKTGAARMAQAADVPILPMALWGSQRVYTKGRRPELRRGKAVTIAVGEPFRPDPTADPAEVTAEMGRRISALLDHLQHTYPQEPAGDDDRWWLPAALGGTAPTPAEAAALDEAERQEREARRAKEQGGA